MFFKLEFLAYVVEIFVPFQWFLVLGDAEAVFSFVIWTVYYFTSDGIGMSNIETFVLFKPDLYLVPCFVLFYFIYLFWTLRTSESCVVFYFILCKV